MPDSLDPPAHARLSDPETSHEAARSVLGIRDSQWLVWSVLLRTGPKADHEFSPLAQAAYRETFHAPITPQSIRSRRAELVKLGLVEFSGKYRPTPNNRRGRVWKALSLKEYRARQSGTMKQAELPLA